VGADELVTTVIVVSLAPNGYPVARKKSPASHGEFQTLSFWHPSDKEHCTSSAEFTLSVDASGHVPSDFNSPEHEPEPNKPVMSLYNGVRHAVFPLFATPSVFAPG
jgi:hypothetical protein